MITADISNSTTTPDVEILPLRLREIIAEVDLLVNLYRTEVYASTERVILFEMRKADNDYYRHFIQLARKSGINNSRLNLRKGLRRPVALASIGAPLASKGNFYRTVQMSLRELVQGATGKEFHPYLVKPMYTAVLYEAFFRRAGSRLGERNIADSITIFFSLLLAPLVDILYDYRLKALGYSSSAFSLWS